MRLTNPLWYLAAFLLAIGSAMAATAVAASAFDPVRDARVTPATERVDAKGATLAIYTDIVQVDRDILCRGRYGDKDKGRIEIPDKGVDVTADSDGTRWHLIGLLEQGRDGLRIVCTPTDKRTDNASYGYATVTGYSSRVNNGRGIAYIGIAAGAVLAGWIFWCRRQARRDAHLASAVVD
ncbi:hypothetical protein [Aeromicrobium wangtongii]|uniref:hypothetical protein n=1 Tax=Aeromicrobium wangtongii TaxID=2969247 RepID=UPI0020170478|nr:hypothetical protein [Aeromicrobium wangtongii]MCL3816974.1 hypothetical protein [Aeromicrobium wangtongii]